MTFLQALAKRVFSSQRQPYEERYYESSDGLKLYYRDYKGPPTPLPVLCIPGLTRNSRDFEFIAAHIARSRRVIVTDLRGRGKSDHDNDPRHYSVAIEAADMIRLLDSADIGKAIVLGTSRGGIVALTMAATRPDRLEGVILNDIGGELEPSGLSRIWEFVGREPPMPSWDAAVAALKRSCIAEFPDVDNARWLEFAHALYREDNGQIVPDYDPKLGDSLRKNIPKILPNGPAVPLWPLLSALAQFPVLTLRGENSDLLSAATLEKMHALKPDLASATVAGRGHAPFLDEPEAVTAIDRFLAELN
jgi:pimeloyl-ACP methyl ester carboxylesterase